MPGPELERQRPVLRRLPRPRRVRRPRRGIYILPSLLTVGNVVHVWAGFNGIAHKSDEPRLLEKQLFMRVKLRSSGKVLEGIVTRDFKLIDEGAQEMREMSEASDWPRAKDDSYEHYGVEFRRLCGKLSSLAKAMWFSKRASVSTIASTSWRALA